MAPAKWRGNLRHHALDAGRRQKREGDELRFTRKGSDLFVTILGESQSAYGHRAGAAAAQVKAKFLGEAKPLVPNPMAPICASSCLRSCPASMPT